MPDVELNWLLDDLAERVSHIEQVLMLSRDGLAVGASAALGKDDAERLAAIAAGFQSLGRGAAEYLAADQVRQIIVEMSGKFLFITASGAQGCLAVVTAAGADLGMVAYEMAMVANRVSGFMPQPRRSLQQNAGGKL